MFDVESRKKAVAFSIERIRNNINTFWDTFPAAQSENYVYPSVTELNWTEGFWSGMLWHAYEMTGQQEFKDAAEHQVELFGYRLEKRQKLNHHDLGFLFILSCVSAYKITDNIKARDIAVGAAELLIERYHAKGEFIQAWGDVNGKDNHRLIIDCLLNIPLLFWASEVTGDEKYRDIAYKHLKTTVSVSIREDFTTYHTFYFDYLTGEKIKGVTHQGYSDDSCWARGQAWGIYGLALAYAYTKDETLISIFNGVTDCFLSKLPADNVPYWDMIFTEGDEPRDTSAAAIAVCGIMEMQKYIKNEYYQRKSMDMLEALYRGYLTKDESNGILTEGMYSRPAGDKPECNIWGDYFFVEALHRLEDSEWKRYW